MQTLVSRETDPFGSAVISITRFQAGTAHNVIPDFVTLGGTLRFVDEDVGTRLRQRIEEASGAALRCAVLCCAVLCCAVLCCAVWQRIEEASGAVVRCAVLCCAVLCGSASRRQVRQQLRWGCGAFFGLGRRSSGGKVALTAVLAVWGPMVLERGFPLRAERNAGASAARFCVWGVKSV
jgi:Peptidase dimerisation domain